MTDWADEIAERVNREQVATVGDREALIAAALRKAKADGMREAAKKCENAEFWDDSARNGPVFLPSTFEQWAEARAAGIESGKE